MSCLLFIVIIFEISIFKIKFDRINNMKLFRHYNNTHDLIQKYHVKTYNINI